MKKKKSIISLLMCLTLVLTMVMPNMLVNAADSSSGMVINKTATANDDGSYKIQLEAYATGSKVITDVTEDIPTDIVLVLDQSGSMANDMGKVSYKAYSTSNNQSSNEKHYERRHNGGSSNLWYKVGNNYYSVSVTKSEQLTYNKLDNLRNRDYYQYSNNLYEQVNGDYQQVTLTWSFNYISIIYTYAFSDGSTVTSSGRDSQPDLGNHAPLYTRVVDDTNTEYTYTYTINGETIVIGTSTGSNTTFTTTLYQRSVSTSGGGSRINALKTALTTFADSVNKKASGADGQLGTADDVNHRIAVVGFATGDYSSDTEKYPKYENTELFIGSNQYNYNVNAANYYNAAFQEMNTQQGYDNVIASKNALETDGATYVNFGMKMANAIFDANPIAEGDKRNRVIVVFTDGQPGWSGYDSDVAGKAITEAQTAKDNGVTIYTVGIFAGADATSAGSSTGSDTEKSNWFMQQVSSNDGTPQDPSYYLSAADAETLNDIFEQISDQIESGGSSTTLSEETVIKDIIAPQFKLPEGTAVSDITIETYACTGKNGDSYTWTNNNSTKGASAVINNDQVSVTGFDFAENYVGTVTDNGSVSYRGDKLVISFNVVPKAGFLGGNNVYTNTSAGVYENSDAENPVLTFNRPQVNVPIKAVSVSSEDKNVYLLEEITADQLKSGTTISVGGVSLNLSQDNYGLDSWQNEYVDIVIAVKDAEGNEISDKLSGLEVDQKYSVYVTVSPKTEGTDASGKPAVEQSGNASANIAVFKPELTYKDRDVYYGESVPTSFSEQLMSTVWKHTDTSDNVDNVTVSTNVTMIGSAPDLDLTYLAESSKIDNDKINSKRDVEVAVTVKIRKTDITNKTEFVHTTCADNCSWGTTTPDGNPAFLLHPKTCSLEIVKVGGIDGEPYVFTVKKDGVKYSEITIVGNGNDIIYELPVGTYTIEEDSKWSWRHTPKYGEAVSLSSSNTSGTISCTNSQNKPYWLNGFSSVVKNIFGGNN